MGTCCTTEKKEKTKKPDLPFYKFCILRSPQYPTSSPIPSTDPETPFYIEKSLNAFAGAKPIFLNLYIKQNLFTADKQAQKARKTFYKAPHAILIELDISHKKALDEIQKCLLDEIRSAQREAQDNGKDLMVAIIAKGTNLHEKEEETEKIEKYADAKGWLVLFTESVEDYLETEYREISEKLEEIGILPETPDNLEDSGIGSFYDDGSDDGEFVRKKKKRDSAGFGDGLGNFGDEL